MKHSSVYTINKPAVVAEVINGELVAIQLENGCYYHANTTGSHIWTMIETGKSSSYILQALIAAYGISEAVARKDSMQFIAVLEQEQLIQAHAETQTQALDLPSIATKTDREYQAPTLKKHEDMRELLLLDPIHDIGENPWPLQEVAAS